MENQLTLQTKIEGPMSNDINNLRDRMLAVEYALFKTEQPDTRFERIYDKMSAMETARIRDNHDVKYLKESLEKKFDQVMFQVEH